MDSTKQLGDIFKASKSKVSPYRLANIKEEHNCSEDKCKKTAYIFYYPKNDYYCWYHSFTMKLCT